MKSLTYYLVPTENKRLKIALFFGVANLLALIGLSIFTKHEIMSIGGALAAINTPVYGYMFAETKRPSTTNNNIDNKNESK